MGGEQGGGEYILCKAALHIRETYQIINVQKSMPD